LKYIKLTYFYEEYLQRAFSENKPEKKSWGWAYPYAYIKEVYPKTKEEVHKRKAVVDCISAIAKKSENDVKIRHDYASTFVYFSSAEDYESAKSIGTEFLQEANVPIVEDILTFVDKLGSIEELRKCLYYREYIYKIHLFAGWNHEIDDLIHLRDQVDSMENVHLNPAMRNLPKSPFNVRSYWRWKKYAIACNTEEDASYISFIAGDFIDKITKAVIVK